jgi:hypothetical protein
LKSPGRGGTIAVGCGALSAPDKKGQMVATKEIDPLQYVISIDPGLAGTGVVHWRDYQPVYAAVMRPLMRDVRQQLKIGEEDLVPRARDLARNVGLKAGVFQQFPTTVVIEFPEYQASADRAMGWKTGSLQRLTMFIGVLIGMMPLTWRVILVTPSGWKGQLPKDVVQRRLTAVYTLPVVERLGVTTHAWDALGIGHWFLTKGN